MEAVSQEKPIPSRGLKQVKVDNWGTFFLQRLQQLYFEEELLDLTIKFPTSDITVQVIFRFIHSKVNRAAIYKHFLINRIFEMFK